MNMKRKKASCFILLSVCLAFLAFGLTGCSDSIKSVEIANKSELAEEWYINDYDRVISVKDGERALGASDVSVTVEDDKIVSIDGLKLRPISVGTTLITVTSGKHSDKIKIQVKARAKKIEISNTEMLSAEWKVGDADRTVEIEVMPDKFKQSDVEFSVESDNENVISASGHTIRAVSAGTAAITVKSGNCSSTLVLAVSPKVE